MTEKKVYCGVDEPKKKERRGTMKECAEMGQIRYYGIKKVDQKMIDFAKRKKKSKVNKQEITKNIVILRGKRKNLERKLIGLKDKDKINEINEELKKIKKELVDLGKMLDSLSREPSKASKRSKKSKASKRSKKSKASKRSKKSKVSKRSKKSKASKRSKKSKASKRSKKSKRSKSTK